MTLARELSSGAERPRVDLYSKFEDVDARFEAPDGGWPEAYTDKLPMVFLLDAKSAESRREKPLTFELGNPLANDTLRPRWGLDGVEDMVAYGLYEDGKRPSTSPGCIALLDLKLWQGLWLDNWRRKRFSDGKVTYERLENAMLTPTPEGAYPIEYFDGRPPVLKTPFSVEELKKEGVVLTTIPRLDALKWVRVNACLLYTRAWQSLEHFAEYVTACVNKEPFLLPPEVEPRDDIKLPKERLVAYSAP